MQIVEGGAVPIYMWTDNLPVEPQALQQLTDISHLPFLYKHVAVMPDVHMGVGACVGSVLATKGAVIPSAVGVDIGCGMHAIRTNIKASHLPDDLKGMRSLIEQFIPVGNGPGGNHKEDQLPGYLNKGLKVVAEWIKGLKLGRVWQQLGTLGGGNHFIELSLDEEDFVWVVLHSGSRGIGNALGTYYTQRAREVCKEKFIQLLNSDLAFLPKDHKLFGEYMYALKWAQDYAFVNRMNMMGTIINEVLASYFPDFDIRREIDCHHNYLSQENHFGEDVWITRKGAVSAKVGERGIIPGAMGAKSFIVKGKGNPLSFNSCSHGAGRKMSRAQAKKTFTLEDHRVATEGVECRKDEGVLDETPGAYKDIDLVMKAQSDLVEIEHTLRAVLCVKG
jgi:tRNA-splicing ligase RtcB